MFVVPQCLGASCFHASSCVCCGARNPMFTLGYPYFPTNGATPLPVNSSFCSRGFALSRAAFSMRSFSL